jgi:AcrR family transcriptional regulator
MSPRWKPSCNRPATAACTPSNSRVEKIKPLSESARFQILHRDPTRMTAELAPLAEPRKKRLAGQEREQQIAQEAVKFFAEVGFDGDTRELARRLGITQSLIYKYFPNKAALIDRVYQEVYLGRWKEVWETIIRDRSTPLEERLVHLYVEYAKEALTWDWVRIFMFSGLRGESINQKYLQLLRSRILEPVAVELRHELGLPTVPEVPHSTAEIELIWSINARIFYFGQRRWIFNVPLEAPLEEMIELTIRHFMAGARVVLPQLVAQASNNTPSHD